MKGHGMSEARSVLGVICSFYDSFFEAEKKIADYIMEHKAQAVDMTVGGAGKSQRHKRCYGIQILSQMRV